MKRKMSNLKSGIRISIYQHQRIYFLSLDKGASLSLALIHKNLLCLLFTPFLCWLKVEWVSLNEEIKVRKWEIDELNDGYTDRDILHQSVFLIKESS